ncbi:MAG: TetR/AcrR family transcriptional regulator [Deltaproteobacteria bacterium]|nr:TetR/AcrR family transcriptional regulator [Deltaproteobacteria bacterium]
MGDQKRIRRDPEAARQLILDAAAAVIAELGPDRATLTAVARRAGISHGLITHYFGTQRALVEHVFEQRMTALRHTVIEQMLERGGIEDLRALVATVINEIQAPESGRLIAWAFLSGAAARSDFFARENRGMEQIADVASTLVKAGEAQRDTIERLMILIWCAAVAYAGASDVLWPALGREASAERDDAFAEMLQRMVERELEST